VSFDSLPFGLFLLAAWVVCALIRNNRAFKIVLLAASYLYCAAWSPTYALVLLGFTLASFWIGQTVRDNRRRFLMSLGIAAAVAVLAFLKGTAAPLPIGISYYTLQGIAFLLESHRGEISSAGLLDYSLYLSFFPRLTAGPIVRPDDYLPQLNARPRVTSADIWNALVLICFGLFKKLVIADNIAAAVNPIFANFADAEGGRLLLATYGFAVQIYCDFSGYTDIALGAARLFGYNLPENFQWPYLAANPADFWRRWHISLSNWLRDYVYFSMPGLRSSSRLPAYFGLVATMVVCGLWHGISWTFVAWGLYHGILLAGYRAFQVRKIGMPRLMSILLMQQLAVVGWILFRADTLSGAGRFIARLASAPFTSALTDPERLAVLLIAAVATAHLVEPWFSPLRAVIGWRWNPWMMLLLLAVALLTVAFSLPQQQMFLYYRF